MPSSASGKFIVCEDYIITSCCSSVNVGFYDVILIVIVCIIKYVNRVEQMIRTLNILLCLRLGSVKLLTADIVMLNSTFRDNATCFIVLLGLQNHLINHIFRV